VEFTGCRVQGRRLTDRHVARCYFVSLIGRTAKGGGFRRGQNHLFGVTIVNITVRHDLGMSVMLGRPGKEIYQAKEGNVFWMTLRHRCKDEGVDFECNVIASPNIRMEQVGVS